MEISAAEISAFSPTELDATVGPQITAEKFSCLLSTDLHPSTISLRGRKCASTNGQEAHAGSRVECKL